ncbi:MAG: hypothetical protein C0412_14655 [Flavobacterium sp.]|nr:hypothetical protein [Flavobacterium sp.]
MTNNKILKTTIVSCLFLLLLFTYFFDAVKSKNFLLPLDIFSEYDPVFHADNRKSYNNLSSDILLQFLPYRAVNDYFKTIVFWNPHSLGGMPFFEDIQARSLEISNIIANIIQIPLKYFFFFSTIFLLMFAGLSMYFFIKELKLSNHAAIFAGIAFIFSSPIIIWINYTIGSTFIWLPFLFLAIEKIYNKKII